MSPSDLSDLLPSDVPFPDAHQGHIWQVHLRAIQAYLPQLRRVLSADEQARADRYLRPANQRDFSLARGMLRHILAIYTRCNPADLIFHYNKYGKPALPGPPHFNLSHSHEYMLLAISPDVPVGIDLEYHDASIEVDLLTERFFAPDEVRMIQDYSGDQRRQAFFKCWTCKEAFVKVCGEGLAMPLKQFVVDAHLNRPARLLSLRGSVTAAASWSLSTVSITDRAYTAALAIAAPELPELQYFVVPPA